MTSGAQQYRQLARDFHFMARSLPPGENRSTLLKMAEECERLADQCERLADQQERVTAWEAVLSRAAMTTRTHFNFRVDTWTPDGESVVEHVAGVEDYDVALA